MHWAQLVQTMAQLTVLLKAIQSLEHKFGLALHFRREHPSMMWR
jgi:hypothetical protein